jgi:hypothetical protein
MSEKKWIKIWLIIILIIPTVALFNYIIDPYGINNFIKIKRVNIYKKSNTPYTIRFKSNIIRNHKFDTLMLGTSRIGGMNPDIVNKYTKGDSFNFEIPGSIIEQQYKMFLYTLKYNHIKHLIYGIDFFSFNANLTIKNDFQEFYELEEEIESGKEIKNYDLYFNIKTLRDSFMLFLTNLRGQKIYENKFLLKNGMREYVQYKDEIRRGVFDIDKKIKHSMNSYFDKERGTYRRYRFSYKYLDYFRKIVDYCKDNNITVHVYIPPIYSKHFDALYIADYFDEFELFKKEIAQITNYTDFTGHNIITDNKNNFWDSSHIRKKFTQMIMAKIFNDKRIEVPKNFGLFVTKNNLNHHLKKLRKELN